MNCKITIYTPSGKLVEFVSTSSDGKTVWQPPAPLQVELLGIEVEWPDTDSQQAIKPEDK